MRKELIAGVLDNIGILDLLISMKSRKNYIRVINYHDTKKNDMDTLEKHLSLFDMLFTNCNFSQLVGFLSGEIEFKQKPGIIITFDDGYVGNYLYAVDVLEKHGYTGMFFVPTDYIGKNGRMTETQLRDLLKRGHYVGSHTCSHHRMSCTDSRNILIHEIEDSKRVLSEILERQVEAFCWVGGEKGTYTQAAFKIIEDSGYEYSFMTNSFPVYQGNDPLLIERTNIQLYWPVSIVKFQLSGIMDLYYTIKRNHDERMRKSRG